MMFLIYKHDHFGLLQCIAHDAVHLPCEPTDVHYHSEMKIIFGFKYINCLKTVAQKIFETRLSNLLSPSHHYTPRKTKF